MKHLTGLIGVLVVSASTLGGGGTARAGQSPPVPDAVVDLRTTDGAAVVSATWRFVEARPVAAEFQTPPAGSAARATTSTHQMEPRPGAPGWDQAGWTPLAPDVLEARRGSGLLSFGWYRLGFTVPERIGSFDAANATIVLECVFDDYAEVWVNGRLSRALGDIGGTVIAGWNAPNRVVLTHGAMPGQQFDVAVFVANGPLSDPPKNYVWARSVTLDVYTAGTPSTIASAPLEIVKHDPAIDAIIEPGTMVETIADGFVFCEGPVWAPGVEKPGEPGVLLFSDPNQNVIHRWSQDSGVTIYRTKSGYSGIDIGRYHQPGSNGLALDREGRLTICEHGNRRVTRLEPNGSITVLADRYEGKRLNSPNDLVYRSDGALYFTDPPFGLPEAHDDPAREQPHFGVYCLKDGRLSLVSTDLRGPNGLAFSPDEKMLYVTNWDTSRKVVMRYGVQPDGGLTTGEVFFDMTSAPEEEALDGVKVDREGNLFISGPGGLWVLSSTGKHLGTIKAPRLPANMAWGDDGKSLYLAARSAMYRIRVQTGGGAE